MKDLCSLLVGGNGVFTFREEVLFANKQGVALGDAEWA